MHPVVDGFEGNLSRDGRRSDDGWKNASLPWSCQLDKAEMYRSRRAGDHDQRAALVPYADKLVDCLNRACHDRRAPPGGAA